MRKTLLSALVASAFAFSGGAQAALSFDLDGATTANADRLISVTAFDWAATSFLAKGGNQAIKNFEINKATGSTSSTEFDVLTHAKLGSYFNALGESASLPTGFGEITMVGRFTETVTSTTADTAHFSATGAGWIEMYYSAENSANLTGSNFNDGRLIMRAEGVFLPSTGSFQVTSPAPVVLDQTINGDDYNGQTTVKGKGDQDTITFGKNGFAVDPTFFLDGGISSFNILFQNISIALPYLSVNPSDCFNPDQQKSAAQIGGTGTAAEGTGSSVGTIGLVSQCDTAHVNGLYSAQTASVGGGYIPVVGPTNGLFTDPLVGPDFIAQTDFNSPVVFATPEPGMVALLGLALGAMGIASRRRRS